MYIALGAIESSAWGLTYHQLVCGCGEAEEQIKLLAPDLNCCRH
jgi:hypothetical protein